MNRRRREILNLLFNLEGCITGGRLAMNYDVSLSTIRLDIKDINRELARYDVKVESQVKKGYFLSEKTKRVIRKNNIIRTIIDKEYINQMPLTPNERQMYFLLQLTKKDAVDLEDLSRELFVSVSTLTNDIFAARRWLKENLDLTFRFSLVEGVSLDCMEQEKRNLVIWIIVNNTNSSSISKYWHYLVDGEGSEIVSNNESLFRVINESAYEHGYILSGHSVVAVATAIGLCNERNKSGFPLESQDGIRELAPVVADIKMRIEAEHSIFLTRADWRLVEDYFVAGQFLRGTDLNLFDTRQPKAVVKEFFKLVKSRYGCDMAKAPGLAGDLELYLVGMHSRLKYHFPIANSLDFDFGETPHLEKGMAVLLDDVIFDHWRLRISERERVYLTLHLIATRDQWVNPTRVMVVCDYDQGIWNYIENLIVARVKNRIEVISRHTYQEIALLKLPEIDQVEFIISTATLKDKTDLPLIVIKPEMIASDIDKTIANTDALMGELHMRKN